MSTILIPACGLIVVVGGILWLRLHAFAALILAALLVAALTPAQSIVRSRVLADAVTVQLTAGGSGQVTASAALDTSTAWVLLPEALPDDVPDVRRVVQFREVPEVATDASATAAYAVQLQDGSAGAVFPAGVTRMLAVSERAFQSAAAVAGKSFVERVTEALGVGCGRLAIMIVAASVIGQCMLRSGAADRVVQTALRWCGERGAPLAFMLSGFTLAIPVFFDTVFLLMLPLARSLYQRTQRNFLLYVLAIVAGGTMAHSLVPPTPGPLLIAEAFQLPLTRMISGGCVVGLVGAAAALLFAVWRNGREPLIPADVAASPLVAADDVVAAGSAALPGLPEALLPVLLPIALLTLETRYAADADVWQLGPLAVTGTASQLLRAACERNIALLLGAVAAVATLVRFRPVSRQDVAAEVQSAITSAGTIILVTAAGGAFGVMLQQTSVAEVLRQIPAASPVAIVVAAFCVTTAVRTAQGSATVAMMTAAGVFGGLVNSGVAGVDPLYVALAVGCGSKPFAWMNDSGFLVITRMSGMTELQGLKNVTTVMAIAGFAGLLAVIVGVVCFP